MTNPFPVISLTKQKIRIVTSLRPNNNRNYFILKLRAILFRPRLSLSRNENAVSQQHNRTRINYSERKKQSVGCSRQVWRQREEGGKRKPGSEQNRRSLWWWACLTRAASHAESRVFGRTPMRQPPNTPTNNTRTCCSLQTCCCRIVK